MKSQVVSLIVLGILLASANVCNGVEYQMIDLSLLSGRPGTARAINDNGQIVGYWGQPGTVGSSSSHGFLYDDGAITDLSPSNYGINPSLGDGSAAYSINDNGQVVGWMEVFGNHRRGFVYEDGIMSELYGQSYELRGHWTEARGINDAGQIVGFSDFGTWDSYQTKYAFLYQDGVATKLWMLGGQALGINNIGEVVGWLQSATGGGRAFVWRDGTMTQLGTLGYSSSTPWGINDNGQVVGDSKLDPSLHHAFLYEDGVMKDLGTFGGNSSAQAINNKGQIVGYSDADDGRHAFLYDNGVMTDLGFGTAYGINDNGWIVGESVGHAVLWVPEPAVPPVADADGPYSIEVGDTLTLDASDSTDADDDIVSYMWDLDDDENFETDAGSQPVFDVNFAYLQSLGFLVDNTYTIHLKVTDSEQQSDIADSTLTIVPKPATVVAVDIKPGSCPNPVNVKSSGVLPVAILGTEDVNVITIDPTSIRLAGVEPLRSSYEDVATPVSDSNDCNCTTDGPDGFLDLTLKFKTQRIVEAVGDVNDGDVRVLMLTGVLFDPMSFETPIEGADCILIRGRHKPINRADINKDGVVNVADFAIIAENWLRSSVVED